MLEIISESFDDFAEASLKVMFFFLGMLLMILFIITAPIWIIPYRIYKNYKNAMDELK